MVTFLCRILMVADVSWKIWKTINILFALSFFLLVLIMKILHIATLNSSKKNSGVVRQMQDELNSAKILSLGWDIQIWAGDSLPGYDFIHEYPSSCYSRLQKRSFFFRHLKKMSMLYDVILLRYMPCDPFLPFFRSSKAKIVYCHHTKETHAFFSLFPGIRGRFFASIELLLGYLSLRNADGIAAVTPEILTYEKKRVFCSNIPSIAIPNGIDCSNFPVCHDQRGGNVKLLFTASNFFSWHGLSEILASFQKCPDMKNIELNLVGKVFEEDLAFIREYNLENRIKVHGFLTMSEIREIMDFMDIGIASFSLGEARLTEACTLKVREYLAAGLPVYSGHIDSGFPDDFGYYKIGPPDIVLMAKFAIESRVYSREEIRNSAKRYIDKTQLVFSLYEWIDSNYSKEVF